MRHEAAPGPPGGGTLTRRLEALQQLLTQFLAFYNARSRHQGCRLRTFLMSNIVPQRPDLNQGPWLLLEERIARGYASTLGQVWVVTGPIFDAQPEYLASRVEIPDAFFRWSSTR